MITILNTKQVVVDWCVKKTPGAAAENFDRAEVAVFAVGGGDVFALTVDDRSGGVLTCSLPAGMPVGVYDLKGLWAKNGGARGDRGCVANATDGTGMLAHCGGRPPVRPRDNMNWMLDGRCLMCSYVDGAFALTDVPEEETGGVPEAPVVKVTSYVASYGYDGLSAYESAVLRGVWHGSESEYNDLPAAIRECAPTFMQDEATRQQNEATRQLNEQGRVYNEQVRKAYYDELQRIIPDFGELRREIDSIHGLSLRNEFGNAVNVGISQRAITQAFLRVWNKLDEITGDWHEGINMKVTPDYFISETGRDVHIQASSANAIGTFEHIAFYFNGELVAEAEDTDFFEYDAHIDRTTEVMCKAQILGVEYTAWHTVTRHNAFFLGGGMDYQDVMDEAHTVDDFGPGMRACKDVEVAEGQHIIIVMDASLSASFIRADMMGIEITFGAGYRFEVDGVWYVGYKSVDTYQAHTYNIDING